MERLTGLIGVAVLLAIAVGISTDRRRISIRVVVAGVLFQFALAFLFLQFAPVVHVFTAFAAVITKIISFAGEGTHFIFGSLADAKEPWGFVFAVQVLPVIIFFAALMGALYHLGVMQRVVGVIAILIRRTLGITGVEALAAAANIFLGQTEAPLCVRPYIPTMTRSQLMGIMVPGFASIAGSVMAAYILMLGGKDEASQILFAKHLMTASMMSAPAGLLMAKIVMPETEVPRDESLDALVSEERTTRNVVDAIAAGATDGMHLAFNVAAMLIAFVAILAMLNWPLHALSDWSFIAEFRGPDAPPLSFQYFFGLVFKPLAWTLGVPWPDCGRFGSLLGHQLVLTEFVAYMRLADDVHAGAISPRAAQIAAYTLCGFANFPSIAIQIGGLSAMAPNRRSDFASLGLRAMTAGALACWMTGAIAGVFIPA